MCFQQTLSQIKAIKLFAPSQANVFSRLRDAESIIETNQHPRRTRILPLDDLAIFLGGIRNELRLAAGAESVAVGVSDCVGQ